MEIELKLLIDPADAPLLRKHPLVLALAIAPPRTRNLVSTYFDTADLFLRQSGAALRVRRVDGRRIQTLKAGGASSAGLHVRDEWESTVAGARPDLRRLCDVSGPGVDWLDWLADRQDELRLNPVFVTKFRRTVWTLRFDDGGEAELALDRGTVEAGEKSAPISEVELELKAGSARRLFELAMEFEETIPLRVSNVSKAERGFALLAPSGVALARAEPIVLGPDASVASGLRSVIGNCLAQIQGNESGVVDSDELESVHQMRVGIRRLRSALRLFGRALECPASVVAEIKWVAATLGAVRDWEVLSATLSKVEGAEGLPELKEAAKYVAARRREAAAAAVMSGRYTRMLLAIGDWMQGPDDRSEMLAQPRCLLDESLGKYAKTTLKRLHRGLVKRAAAVDGNDAGSRHALRKYARKVRYASEFFKSFQDADDVRSYVKNLTRLQDELGRSNDAVVAMQLLGELAASDNTIRDAAMFARGFLARGAAMRMGRLKQRLAKIERNGMPRLR